MELYRKVCRLIVEYRLYIYLLLEYLPYVNSERPGTYHSSDRKLATHSYPRQGCASFLRLFFRYKANEAKRESFRMHFACLIEKFS